MLSQTSVLLGLAASASAHITMMHPVPFGVATLNSSPLGPAEFPCKQRPGVYSMDGGMNQWNAGETKNLDFKGSAVHSGGSCQFSLSTDSEPTKDSQWKVIHSIIGGCLQNQTGNLGDNAAAEVATVHPVTMPSNIPDGRYTFAWSWLNKEGNREFYMNCAPVQVGGSSSAPSTNSAAQALSALPDMFVANLPSKDTPAAEAMGLPTCTTSNTIDFVYPDPGQSIVKGSINVALGSETVGTGCAAQAIMGAGAGKIGSPSPGTPSTPSNPSTPSKPSKPSKPSIAPYQPQVSEKPAPSPATPVKGEPQPSKIPTNPGGGIFAPGASPAPAASSAPAAVPTPQPSPPAAAKPSPPAANPAPVTPPQTGSDNNTTPSNGECTPCTNDGAVVCIGTNQFGLCNRGCAVAQDLAAGMSCVAGVVVGSEKKRHAFPRAHLKRHFTAHGHHF